MRASLARLLMDHLRLVHLPADDAPQALVAGHAEDVLIPAEMLSAD
jgi:hypothetical protein